MTKPLLSIVVPTKDRYDCLKCLIALIDGFKCPDIEMIIQDNTCDNTAFLKYLNESEYSFVKYYYTQEQISVCDNSELAILHATGEYISFIGDDDGVVQCIMEYVSWMKQNSIDALIVQNPIYTWPGVQSKVFDFSGTLMLKKSKGKLTPISPLLELRKVLSMGGVTLARLPRIYQGIVSRHALEQLHEACGTFFPGPSPDMANAVALSFIIKKCFYLDLPLIISGQSKKSSAGMGASHQHKGEIKSVPFLPQNCEALWEKSIPRIWTGETVWAESCVKALKNMGHDELYSEFNLNALYAKFLLNNSQYALDYLRDKPYKSHIVWYKFAYYYCLFSKDRILALFRNVMFMLVFKNNRKVIKGLDSILNASAYLMKHISPVRHLQ